MFYRIKLTHSSLYLHAANMNPKHPCPDHTSHTVMSFSASSMSFLYLLVGWLVGLVGWRG